MTTPTEELTQAWARAAVLLHVQWHMTIDDNDVDIIARMARADPPETIPTTSEGDE